MQKKDGSEKRWSREGMVQGMIPHRNHTYIYTGEMKMVLANMKGWIVGKRDKKMGHFGKS
jgi:hypothetical protein